MSRQLLLWLAILLPALLLGGQAAFSTGDAEFLKHANECLDACDAELIVIDSCRVAIHIDEDGNRLYYVQSDDFCRIRGYNGITSLEIVMDHSGEIRMVRVMESEDTRSFVRRVVRSSFLDQFIGYRGEEGLNAVTGATMTSEAIIKSVWAVLGAVKRNFLRPEAPGRAASY